MRTSIYVVTDACSCKLCKGTEAAITPLDKEAFRRLYWPNWKAVTVGGRYPRLVIYDSDDVEPIVISSKGNPEYEPLYREAKIVFEISHSVHSCWKRKENQSMRFYTKKQDIEVANIVYTRDIWYDDFSNRYVGAEIDMTYKGCPIQVIEGNTVRLGDRIIMPNETFFLDLKDGRFVDALNAELIEYGLEVIEDRGLYKLTKK